MYVPLCTCTRASEMFQARSQSCEFQVNPKNPSKLKKHAKYCAQNLIEILSLTNTCWYNIFETYMYLNTSTSIC